MSGDTVEPARPVGTTGRPRPPRSVDDVLAEVRRGLDRVDVAGAERLVADGGLLVDIRPFESRSRHGELPGAVVIDRNVLEWRLDPASAHRIAGIDGDTYDRPIVVVCNEGYASSFAAADLQRLGLHRATDLIGGFGAWVAAGRPVVPFGG